MIKIYIASSWKNESEAKALAELLRSWNFEVDCFCDDSTGRYVFHYSKIDKPKIFDAISYLEDERTQKVFRENKKWIDWCDVLVMLLPCGKSSHLEAGYAKGTGKKLYILGEFPKGEFDAMYGFADGLFRLTDIDKFKRELLRKRKIGEMGGDSAI